MKINAINENGLKKGGKVVKENIGKGRILLTIDKLSVAAAACFEFLRELPGFEYLKSIGVGNLTTKFNTWISSITTTTPDLTGLTPEQIFELGKTMGLENTNESANFYGLIFSSILEFVVQHPTVAVLAVVSTTTLVAKLVGIIKSKLNKESPSKAR